MTEREELDTIRRELKVVFDRLQDGDFADGFNAAMAGCVDEDSVVCRHEADTDEWTEFWDGHEIGGRTRAWLDVPVEPVYGEPRLKKVLDRLIDLQRMQEASIKSSIKMSDANNLSEGVIKEATCKHYRWDARNRRCVDCGMSDRTAMGKAAKLPFWRMQPRGPKCLNCGDVLVVDESKCKNCFPCIHAAKCLACGMDHIVRGSAVDGCGPFFLSSSEAFQHYQENRKPTTAKVAEVKPTDAWSGAPVVHEEMG